MNIDNSVDSGIQTAVIPKSFEMSKKRQSGWLLFLEHKTSRFSWCIKCFTLPAWTWLRLYALSIVQDACAACDCLDNDSKILRQMRHIKMTNIQITNQTFIDPLQPRDYGSGRSSTLYQSQFKPDFEKVAKDYLATMMALWWSLFQRFWWRRVWKVLLFWKKRQIWCSDALWYWLGRLKQLWALLLTRLKNHAHVMKVQKISNNGYAYLKLWGLLTTLKVWQYL